MIVVSDNGPVGFLIQIGRVEILPALFDRVVLPSAVAAEFRNEGTLKIIRTRFASLPSWLEVESPQKPAGIALSGLGEREAIELAKELRAALLCDDRQGVSQAKREGLRVTGTLGVLREAHARGWLEMEDAITDLRTQTDFRLPEALLPEILEQAHRMRHAWSLLEGEK